MATIEKLTFQSWQRPTLLKDASRNGGRLKATLSLEMTDVATGQQAAGSIDYGFIGAADIAGIQRSAIKHLAPAPNTPDAEVTKWPHIDFWEIDFPWRYAPRPIEADKVPPWLVLLAGTVDELVVTGSLVTVTSDAPLMPRDLPNEAHLWAHVQHDGNRSISRVLAARELPPQKECVAVLVPAFGDTGDPIWVPNGNGGVTRKFGSTGVLPVLFSWRFWTAEAGDFETLATALRVPNAGQTGLSDLYYRRAAVPGADPIEATLQIRGAITSLKLPPESAEYLATVAEVAADVAEITADVTSPDRPALSMPAYGRPWLPNPKDIASGWPRELNSDPRNRGIAGLGVSMGVEAQEALMQAAVEQAGALREASQMINHLAIGLAAGGSLWQRRLSTDSRQRLRVLGPMMDRLTDENDSRALDTVTALPSPLPPAFFSGAAQRIMRSRSSATRHLSTVEGRFDIAAATDCVNVADPPLVKAPPGLPHIDQIAVDVGAEIPETFMQIDGDRVAWILEKTTVALDEFTIRFRQQRAELIAAGQESEIPNLRVQLGVEVGDALYWIIEESSIPCTISEMLAEAREAFGMAYFEDFFGWALADDGFRERLIWTLRTELGRCLGHQVCKGPIEIPEREAITCDDIIDSLPPPPPSEHKPVDIDRLSDGLVKLLDPRRPDAPARRRLCARLENIDCSRLIPPEYPIGIDFPTWDLLRQYEKEWLLPGARSLPPDSITALQTNPAFVDAYMTGINAQFLAEMRWRDLAVDRTCTPLRMFWGQVDYTSGDRSADIEPLWVWAASPDEHIGSLAHQTIKPDDPANTTGSRLVIAFHTDLFRRYPATLVYLVRAETGPHHQPDVVDPLLTATPELEMPASQNPVTWRQGRTHIGPTFSGAIKPDLVFFTFDVTPDELDQYWLVLDEPPAELRFRVKPHAEDGANAAKHAETHIDKPTRVAIDGKELRAMGVT